MKIIGGLMKQWKDHWFSGSPLHLPSSSPLCAKLPPSSCPQAPQRPSLKLLILTFDSSPHFNATLASSTVQRVMLCTCALPDSAQVLCAVLTLFGLDYHNSISIRQFFLPVSVCFQSCLSREHIFSILLWRIFSACRMKSKFCGVASKCICFLTPTFLCNWIFIDLSRTTKSAPVWWV